MMNDSSIVGLVAQTTAAHWPWLCLLSSGLYVAYYSLLHPLARVPGPLLAKFSFLWLNIRYFRGTWMEDVVAPHETYGNVVRIAPNEVSFVDEKALKELYGHGKPSVKSKWYDTWVIPGMSDSFFATRDAKIHRRVRGRVSGTYSMSAILGMESLISDVMRTNMVKLREMARSNEPVRMDKWANYFTFDVVAQLSMGGMIGFLDQGEDVNGIIRSVHDGFYAMANFGHIPFQTMWTNNALSRYLIRNFGGERLNSFENFVIWLDKQVTQRMCDGLGDRRPDMLQYFIDGKMPNGEPVGKGEVMIEGVNILGAGADTTAVAILAVLGALLKHPDAYNKLQKALDQAYLEAGIEEDEESREISYKEAEKVPYLAAVVRESIRLHPSITYQLPRVPPPQGVQIGPYHVPNTVNCGISAGAMNRSTDFFGSNASEWIPERWIPHDDSEEEAKRIRVMEQNLTTFGMGSRSCIGRNLAMVETHKYIAAFVHAFDATLANPAQPWVTKSQWFSYQRNFGFILKERRATPKAG